MADFIQLKRYAGGGEAEPAIADTMLDAMARACIMSVSREGEFLEIREACDNHFAVILTREQVEQLASELLDAIKPRSNG